MPVFPTLDTLRIMRDAPVVSDSDSSKNFNILYLHPQSPLPLIQPYNVALHPDRANGPGHGIRPNPWAASFHLQIRGGPYQPSGTTVSTVVGLTIDETGTSTPNGIFVFLYGGPPFSASVCTDQNTCTRDLSTCYCTVHGIAMAVNGVGELRSATPADQWVIWEWFRKNSCTHPQTLNQNFDPYL